MMAATSTKQHECIRHVTEDTLESLNLKIENNFYEYVVIMVGIDDRHLFENLPKIISVDRIQLFNDIITSLNFIRSLSDTSIFLIISGTLGKKYACEFANEPQVIGLYIYCMVEDKHTLWTKEIEKIRCTSSDTTKLLIRLHSDIKQLTGRWPFDEKSFQKVSTSSSQWYYLFLLIICHRSEHLEQSYGAMFNECRAYYKNNPRMIKRIDDFAQTYKSEKAILEYTKDSFVYHIVNHALRTQNMEVIRKFSPFIRDLHSQLHDYHRKYYLSSEQNIRAVYRGQNLSPDELEYLRSVCKSGNPVITLSTFASTSLDPDIAMEFVFSGGNRIPCLFEIIITDEYNNEHKDDYFHEQAFADISSLSVIPTEKEVLFSLVTHFLIKDVGDPINQSNHPWVPIVLQLVRIKQQFSYFDIVTRIKNVTDPKVYNDILHMLQTNAADELKFNVVNWDKWWNTLKKRWGRDYESEQSLLLTFYDCFTEDKYWSRKAIEMHKDILRSTPGIKSISSSFSDLFKTFKNLQSAPMKGIALYEEYLEQLCTKDTKEIVQCLVFAGDTYKNISYKDCALKCYQKAFDINVDDKYKMNSIIQKQIKVLKKSSRTIQSMQNERPRKVKHIDKPSIKNRLERLYQYLIYREEWYDVSDSKIILRLPYEHTDDLSVNDYRSNFLSAVSRHLSSSFDTTDAANNRSLSLWRYEKYMYEWTFLKALEKFLQPFQKKSKSIRFRILPRLERFLKKMNVLITLCTAYICIKQRSGKINMNKIQFINLKNTKMKQPIFFDLHDSDLLADLEALEEEEEASVTEETSITIPDYQRFISSDSADFIATL